ncbi:hypothetical protein [Spirosoma migulaei]
MASFFTPLTRVCFCLLLVLSLDQCKQPSVLVPATTTPTRDDNMGMGNPDEAKSKESSPNTYLNSMNISILQ